MLKLGLVSAILADHTFEQVIDFVSEKNFILKRKRIAKLSLFFNFDKWKYN